jgi:hypothetical protein
MKIIALPGRLELFGLAVCLSGMLYMSLREPILFVLFAIVWFLSFITNTFLDAIQCPKIKWKYWVLLFATVGFSFCLWEQQPARAFFFVRLENFFVDLANQAASGAGGDGGGGGDGSAIANGIRIMFNLVRGGLMILAAVTVWRGYQQSSERQEWFPIVTPVFMGLLVIIAIEVLSFMFLSGGTAQAGGGGGP